MYKCENCPLMPYEDCSEECSHSEQHTIRVLDTEIQRLNKDLYESYNALVGLMEWECSMYDMDAIYNKAKHYIKMYDTGRF